MTTLYTAVATAKGGRAGKVAASDGRFEAQLSTPKGLGGDDGPGTNPEQLFAAGYAACFQSAVHLVARMKRVALDGNAITAHVSLFKAPDGAYRLGVELHGAFPGMPRAQAEELMNAAHAVCPYSNATRGNVDVKLVVE